MRWDTAVVWRWNFLGVRGLGIACGRRSARGGRGLRTQDIERRATALLLVRGARLPGHPFCKCPPFGHVAPSRSRSGAGVAGREPRGPLYLRPCSSEAWGPGHDIRDVCLARLVCLFVWPHGGGLGWVLNAATTLGWAWGWWCLCSLNLHQVESPEEGMGLRTLGAWESSGRHGTSREAVSDSTGKVFPVPGLRKVYGSLGWSGAQGEGAGRGGCLHAGPAHSGGYGDWGRGCLGSLFWPPDGWTTECQCLRLDGRPSSSPTWFCGYFLVSARKP